MKKLKLKKLVEAVQMTEANRRVSDISRVLKTPESTIRDWLKKVQENCLSFKSLTNMTDDEIEEILFPRSRLPKAAFLPNWDEYVAKAHLPKVSERSLYDEYEASVPENMKPMSMATFYRELKKLKAAVKADLKPLCEANTYFPGEKCQIDYSGQGVPYVDPETTTTKTAQIFVSVLPYSSYTFVMATVDQKRQSWLKAIADMFAFYGGVTKELWLDNATTLVNKADKYDPKCSDEFKNFCKQYDVIPYPVAPRSPTHKASVERAVGLVQRKILNKFSNRCFQSVDQINEAIKPLLKEFNDRPLSSNIAMKNETRYSRYLLKEKPVLKALPQFEYKPDCVIFVRKVLENNIVRIDNARIPVDWGHVGESARIFVNKESGAIDVYTDEDGEYIGHDTLAGRSLSAGTRSEQINECLRKFIEDKQQLITRIEEQYGENAHLVALGLAKQNNSYAIRHLHGMLFLARKMDLSTFDEMCGIVLSRPPITYTRLHEIYVMFVKQKKILSKTAPNCKASDESSSTRGADYYNQYGKKRLEELRKKKSQSIANKNLSPSEGKKNNESN